MHQEGSGALTGMFVDDVQLTLSCGSASPTPAPKGYTRTEVAPDAASSSIRVINAIKVGARGETSQLPAASGLPIRRLSCFAYEMFALRNDLTKRRLPVFKDPEL